MFVQQRKNFQIPTLCVTDSVGRTASGLCAISNTYRTMINQMSISTAHTAGTILCIGIDYVINRCQNGMIPYNILQILSVGSMQGRTKIKRICG